MKKEKGKILLKNLVANVFAAITIVARITCSRCVGAMAVLATASAVAVPPPHASAHARQWAVVLLPLLSRMRCSRGSGIASSQIIRSFLRSDVDSSSYHDVLNDSRNGSIETVLILSVIEVIALPPGSGRSCLVVVDYYCQYRNDVAPGWQGR